jgi:Transglutaminase-like superfamily
MPRPKPIVPRAHQRLAPWQRLALSAEILWSYLAVRWAMRREDLPAALARLRAASSGTRHPALGRSVEDDDLAARRIGYAVMAILRLLPTDGRCLMQSLVLTRLLARRSLPSSVVIGVSSAPEFLAHAWVEYAGRPLLPAYGPAFARLVEL